MSILLLSVLLVLSIVLLLLKRTKSGITSLILALVLFLSVGMGIVPTVLLGCLQKGYAPLTDPVWRAKNNAVVILGAGLVKVPETGTFEPGVLSYSRLYESLKLYQNARQENKPCTLIISGGDVNDVASSEALVYKNALLPFKVPKSDIYLESESKNTYQNAEFTSQYLKKMQFEQVFLVTSALHLKRAVVYFKHFGVSVIPVPSDYIAGKLSFLPLGYNFAITDFALHEYMGLFRYYLYESLGLNR